MINTQERLEKLFREAYKEVKVLGLPVGELKKIQINNRLTVTLGRCKKTNSGYIIEIAEYLLKEAPDKDIKNTMVHELIHTFPKCLNHGHEFYKYANILNEKYGYNISRANETPWRKADSSNYKYMFKCSGCGQIIVRQRKSRFTEHPELYTCGSCGEKFKRIK